MDTKAVNIKEMPSDLWDRVRVLAIQKKRTYAAIVAEALRLYFEQQNKDAWKPSWHKPYGAECREMETIPAEWGASKVVLIWRSEKEQDVRIFASSEQAMQRTWKGLFGGGVLPSALMKEDHWEFRITRTQYDTAGG